jgi:16S rRNA (uracil1498-N3)-methyltransferase
MLWEREGQGLKDAMEGYFKGRLGGFGAPPQVRIYAMVGPEGGFSEEEVSLAREKGFIPVKLGQRILRTETAAITLIGILQYELGDLG